MKWLSHWSWRSSIPFSVAASLAANPTSRTLIVQLHQEKLLSSHPLLCSSHKHLSAMSQLTLITALPISFYYLFSEKLKWICCEFLVWQMWDNIKQFFSTYGTHCNTKVYQSKASTSLIYFKVGQRGNILSCLAVMSCPVFSFRRL